MAIKIDNAVPIHSIGIDRQAVRQAFMAIIEKAKERKGRLSTDTVFVSSESKLCLTNQIDF